jgi:hypothetical protein
MKYFIEQLLTLLPVLNFTFAIPVLTIPVPSTLQVGDKISTTPNTNSLVFIAISSDYNAKAQEINGQFIVLKGSQIRKEVKSSLGDTYRDKREQFIKDGKLGESSDGVMQFTVDIPFSSPSGAASVVTGTSVNGREFWKVQGTAQTYNQWDQNRVAQAETAIIND